MAVFMTGGQAAEQYDENTLLLLHGEDLKDSSMYGHNVTNNGIEILHPTDGSVADETTTSWYVKPTAEIVAGRAYLVSG